MCMGALFAYVAFNRASQIIVSADEVSVLFHDDVFGVPGGGKSGPQNTPSSDCWATGSSTPHEMVHHDTEDKPYVLNIRLIASEESAGNTMRSLLAPLETKRRIGLGSLVGTFLTEADAIRLSLRLERIWQHAWPGWLS